MRIRQLLFALFLAASLVQAVPAAPEEGGKVATADGARIHYQRAGAGDAMLLIPGWSFSGEIFARQIEFFAKSYDVIAIDPRGQGKSSKGAAGNSYRSHGADLAAVVAELGLGKAHWIGWSWGCYDIFSYVRQFGPARVQTFVCLDEPPLGWSADPQEWAGVSTLEGLAALYRGVADNRRAFLDGFVPWMVTRPLTDVEREELVEMSLQTPEHVAVALAADGMLADYSTEAEMLDRLAPTFFIIREEMESVAAPWMARRMPNTRTLFKGGHMMFWEFPQEINAAIAEFLQSARNAAPDGPLQ